MCRYNLNYKWPRVTNVFKKENWFLAQYSRNPNFEEIEKNEKNWKKFIKSELLGATDMAWTCPGHTQDLSRTCPGHGRTHEDSYGSLKSQNRTKTHQDTDIFVLQIAEQTFQICSHFATKEASKIESLCSQDMTRTWQDTCGVIGVFEKSEFDQKWHICTANTVTPQPMNLMVIQSIEKLSVQWKAQYSICSSLLFLSSFGINSELVGPLWCSGRVLAL